MYAYVRFSTSFDKMVASFCFLPYPKLTRIGILLPKYITHLISDLLLRGSFPKNARLDIGWFCPSKKWSGHFACKWIQLRQWFFVVIRSWFSHTVGICVLLSFHVFFCFKKSSFRQTFVVQHDISRMNTALNLIMFLCPTKN